MQFLLVAVAILVFYLVQYVLPSALAHIREGGGI